MYRYACTGTHATVTYFEAGITDLCVQTTSFVRMAREKRFCCLLYTQDEPGKKKIIGTSRKYHEPTEYDDGYESKQTNKRTNNNSKYITTTVSHSETLQTET